MIHSDRWNPLSEVASDIDAQMFCEVLIANTSVPGHKGGDPF
jgi:type IV secretion system protein VirD4